MTVAAALEASGVWKRFRLRGRSIAGLARDLLEARRPAGAGDLAHLWALSDVSFEVPRGSAFGLIGANGSGKSTLLKIAAGMMAPTRGRLAIHGRMALLTHLGGGFHPELTGRENIFLQGAILGLGRADLKSRLEAILAFAELERFADVPVKFYSAGMTLRLGFSVAAHVDPEVLLVDEALAVGDAAFRDRCLERLLEFRERGVTLVLVSHERYLVEQMCDAAVLLDHGRLVAEGRPDEVFGAYERLDDRTDSGGMVVEGDPARSPWALERFELVGYPIGSEPVLQVDAPLVIRLKVRATRAVRESAVGVNVAREWHVLHGSRCSRQGIVLQAEQGEAIQLEIAYPHVALARGSYALNVLLFENRLSTIPVLVVKRAARFRVDHAEAEGVGLVRLAHAWRRID
ncbi:MAG: polysaccharide ABC transporter ATP-binding protein [Gemmatimonadales bacterium]